MGGRSPYLHVPVQLIRELRSPQRQRFASARHGQDLRALRRPAWRHTAVHPLESLRRLVGSGDRDGPVWGVTMVRDEEVRVRGAIERLFAGGVDAVLVADHGSTDATVEVLRSIALDLPVLIVADREPAYYQGPKMSRLARAAARCGASWVVPFDADELWFGTDEPLAAALRHLDGDIAVAALYDYLPAIDADPLASRRPYQTQTRRRPSSLTSKVAFRAHHLAALSSGNHLVSQPGRRVHDRISDPPLPLPRLRALRQEGNHRRGRARADRLHRRDLVPLARVGRCARDPPARAVGCDHLVGDDRGSPTALLVPRRRFVAPHTTGRRRCATSTGW